MNIKFCVILLFSLIFIQCNSTERKKTEKVDQSFFRIPVKFPDGGYYNLAQAEKSTAAVFIFMSPECPVCQSYSLTINNLIKKYVGNTVMFYGIFPGTYYSNEKINYFLKEYSLNFTPLCDPEFKITKSLNAKVTPEAFVMKPNGEILYHGLIDDWYYAVGKKRSIITKNYLQDILDSIVHEKPTNIQNTEAIGCIIE